MQVQQVKQSTQSCVYYRGGPGGLSMKCVGNSCKSRTTVLAYVYILATGVKKIHISHSIEKPKSRDRPSLKASGICLQDGPASRAELLGGNMRNIPCLLSGLCEINMQNVPL